MAKMAEAFKSRLSDILLTDPSFFVVLLPNGSQVHIAGYSNININFEQRVEYRDGRRFDVTLPLVTYMAKMNAVQKLELYELFSNGDSSATLTMHSRSARVAISQNKYVFNCVVDAIPSALTGDYTPNRSQGSRGFDLQNIKIDVDFRDLIGPNRIIQGDVLFEEVDEAILNRAEILDI